jgi:hypothetical protein
MFRNYQSPQQSGTEVTLVEALRAAWATPGLIAPKLVGPTGREEELVSAVNGFNNPIQEAIKEAYTTFGPDARIACLLSLGSGQRGVISLDEKDVTPRKLGMQMVTDSDIVAEEVRKRIGRLRIYHRLSVDRGLEGWELFRRGFGVIKSHVDAYLSKDAVNGILEDCLNVSRSVNNVSMERICESWDFYCLAGYELKKSIQIGHEQRDVVLLTVSRHCQPFLSCEKHQCAPSSTLYWIVMKINVSWCFLGLGGAGRPSWL